MGRRLPRRVDARPALHLRGASDPESTAARNSLEATITAEATFVTVADDSLELRDLPPDAARRVTIANGVDPDDFRGRRPTSPPSQGRLRLSHVGTLHHLRNGDTVFTALRDALGSGRVDARAIDLRLVGWTTPAVRVPGDLPISATGYVGHAPAVDEMLSASALLFYEEAEMKAATGKVYEYLATGLPILSVAPPDNRGACLIRELDVGWCVDVRDRRGVAAALAELQRAWAEGRLRVKDSVGEEALRRFSRRDRAAELASVLRQAAVRAGPARSDGG